MFARQQQTTLPSMAIAKGHLSVHPALPGGHPSVVRQKDIFTGDVSIEHQLESSEEALAKKKKRPDKQTRQTRKRKRHMQ